MTGRTHDAAALTFLLVAAAYAPPQSLTLSTALVAILANQMGGVTPDIDQPTAPFWHNLPAEGFLGKIFDKLSGGHRFITHSIAGLLIFAWVSRWFLGLIHPLIPAMNTTIVWYAFLIGLFSHLVMDTFTKEGVPWLLPIPVKFGFPPAKALRITTGHAVESFIIFPGLVVIDVWLISIHYHAIITYIHLHLHA